MLKESSETILYNHNFIEQLKKDIKKFDILYICVPFGWGKDTLLKEFYINHREKEFCWLEEMGGDSLEKQIENIPAAGKRVFLIPRLELIIEHGHQEIIWKLLMEKKKGDVFLFASSVPVPEDLLPFTIFNRFVQYGIEVLKPEVQDIKSYMKSRDIELTREELLLIENDCNNMPLFVQLLANLMSGTDRRYSRIMKEQCFEDLFTYIDVVFFRRFSKEDQNALLKLSCFEEFDNKLISYMLNIQNTEVKAFVERVFNKSSVLEKSEFGWKFQPLMKSFFERGIQKYLDYEERLSDYHKAMHYLMKQKKWLEALRFAYILQEKEQMAICLDQILTEKWDYSILVELDGYFRELTIDNLVKYPNLMIAGAIIKACIGDREGSKRYEKLFLNYLEQMTDEEKKKTMQYRLLFMYMSCPDVVEKGFLEKSAELLSAIDDDTIRKEQQKFEPHFISVLRGEKDYCNYFLKGETERIAIENLYEAADRLNDRSFYLMLKFMEAEVLYEKNDLDHALDELAKVTKEAKYIGSKRIQWLCTIAMMDLLASRNQMNRMETLRNERLEESDRALFYDNCQAHMIYYHLLKNNQTVVYYWLKVESPNENEHFFTIKYYQYLIKAKVYIWMEQYVRGRMILQLLLDFAEEYGMEYLEAQVRILEAVVYYREGSLRWKEILIPALEWGRKLEFIRVFADEGAAVYELLVRISQEEKEWGKDSYLKKVLSATKAHMLQYPKYLKKEKKGEISEFSGSERSVMGLLVLGQKNAEIAEQLCVSENTVKYHLKNIYQKLQVKSRSQAIHKIREYELI